MKNFHLGNVERKILKLEAAIVSSLMFRGQEVVQACA
jgi:hypothetical protein